LTTSTVPRAIIVGEHSDIGAEISSRLIADVWRVRGWSRGDNLEYISEPWDLLLIPLGRVSPVGPWHTQRPEDFIETLESNLTLPYSFVHRLWPLHRPGASICFMAGSNPNKPMPGYLSYSVSKMALLKLCEHLDLEMTDAKCFAIAPGTVLTKIHDATRRAQWDNPVLKQADEEGENRQAKIDRIYGCLKWCIEQPKEVVGGRNICASDPWTQPWHSLWLRQLSYRHKLRRHEK